MSWRRNARIAAGVVGLGCAAALFILRRDRPPVAPPPTIASVDPNSVQESERGTLLLPSKDGRQHRLNYERMRTYEDGRTRFEQATLKIEGDDPFEVKAGVIETLGKGIRSGVPDEVKFSDTVVMTTPGGLHLETDVATYQDGPGVVAMPGKVTFGRDRMSGSGTGAKYRRDARTLELLADARVSVAADAAGAGALEATAATMVLNRAEHAMYLDGAAVIRLETQSLEGGKINLLLTEDDRAVKHVRLLGAAKVSPVEGGKNPGPAMNAEAIDLVLRPDGRTVQRATLAGGAFVGLSQDTLRAPWIELHLAPDGSTVTRLDARDGVHMEVAPVSGAGARTIDARTLAATGTPKVGLTSARFDADVRFGEAAAAPGGAPIKSTARVLVLTLSGGLGAIDSAEFQGGTEFTDGVVTATADRAIYDALKDRLELRQGDRRGPARPTVQDGRVQITGDAIDLQTQTHDMRATGTVETQLLPERGAAAADPAGLFDRSRPILGAAPVVDYSSRTGRAIYKASAESRARVWQDANDVTADEITLDDKTQNLSARRRVRTVLEMAPPGGAEGAKPVIYRIGSEEADFDQTTRRAMFKGQPVELIQEDQRSEGRTLEVRLAAKTRTVDGFTLRGDVLARLPEGREALGDRLEYDAGTDTYKVIGDGKLALVKSPGEAGGRCGLSKGLLLEFDRKRNVFRSDGAGSTASNDPIPCETPLRSIPR